MLPFRFPPISPKAVLGASRQDYLRFLEIATGSLYGTVSQATIAHHQKFLDLANYQQVYQAAEKQGRMLSGLRKSLKSI